MLENLGLFQQLESISRFFPKEEQREAKTLCDLLFRSLIHHLTIMELVSQRLNRISNECGLNESFKWLKVGGEFEEIAKNLEKQVTFLASWQVFARARWESEKLPEKDKEEVINLLLQIMVFWVLFSSTMDELLSKLSTFGNLPGVSRLVSFMSEKIAKGGEENG